MVLQLWGTVLLEMVSSIPGICPKVNFNEPCLPLSLLAALTGECGECVPRGC